MKQTINDLWRGNIRPCEENSDKFLVEKELKRFIDENRDVMEQLDDKGKASLLELIASLEKLWSDACDEAFAKGFSLATRLMAESLT